MPNLRLEIGDALPTPLGAQERPDVHWPTLPELLKHMRTRPTNVGRFLGIAAAFLRSYGHRGQFEALVDRSQVFKGLQLRGAEAFTPLFRALLDRRYGMGRRFAVYGRSVNRVEQLLRPEAIRKICNGARVVLVQVDDLVVDFGVNELSMEEGLWSLALRSQAGHRLSNISFSFLSGDRLLIGSIQGPKMENGDALADIRRATHTLHGMRPPYFAMAVLKSFARSGGLQLLGIDPAVKARLRQWPWSKPYHFDYRAFWREHAGQASDDGYWKLDLAAKVRALKEAPPRKRAMYARRAEMIAAIDPQLQAHFAQGPRAGALETAVA